jgi:hypothetical protein
MRTYWLSFTDQDRPAGGRFLGVTVIDVTADQAEAIRPELPPQAQPGAEWIAAACRAAWDMGCNPGGTVASYDITGRPEAVRAPHARLLSRAELRTLGLIDGDPQCG